MRYLKFGVKVIESGWGGGEGCVWGEGEGVVRRFHPLKAGEEAERSGAKQNNLPVLTNERPVDTPLESDN